MIILFFYVILLFKKIICDFEFFDNITFNDISFKHMFIEEKYAIRWHMGTSEIATQLDNDYKFAFSKAWDICPLAYLLHQADSMASFLLEDKVEAPNKR